MYDDHHRMRARAGRQMQVGALRAVGAVAVQFTAREEIEDQPPGDHSPAS